MSAPKSTPMMNQYLSIKSDYEDAILFYRMGDFYEMFFEDAEKASKALEITLTSRNKNVDEPVPMCGFPVKAADGYIARLISQGFKVAVCEQVEDPKTAKGLVKRDVVRIVTPGMIVDDNLLDAKSNNYILAFSKNKKTSGMACLDISTGSFRITESREEQALIEEALRVAPSEIILPDSAEKEPFFLSVAEKFSGKALTYIDERNFNRKNAHDSLIRQFKTRSLEGFGAEDMTSAISAAGALLSYVQETQKQTVEHITGIETYSLGSYLMIDDSSCRNLELISNLRNASRDGTLLGIIDKTVTSMGGRLLKNWIRYPLLAPDVINKRLDAVQECLDKSSQRHFLREHLKSVYDLERLGSKISMGQSNARDLTALKKSLQSLPHVIKELDGFESDLFKYEADVSGLDELANLIDRAVREDAPPLITEGGIIKSGYNAELDELISISRDGKTWLASLEAREKEKTGINTLKVKFNKVFGYFIEVSKASSADVPENYIRKQTLVNAERYITDELKDFESNVMTAQDRRADLEYRVFLEIRDEIVKKHPLIIDAARFLAKTDVLSTLAEIADENGYTRPQINRDGLIRIEDGRHPVVEKMISGERYVPNSIELDNTEKQVIVITGPNMAGKSTVLRQVAILTLMAQMGSFVPAKSAAISITDKIFTRVGALDNLSQGQSTFMVEMEETANIVNNATPDSLIIMDEIGRGTSTFDGLSIAWAVAEYLHDFKNKGVKTLFATHYHELTDLAKTKKRVKNYNIAVKEWNDEIIFLRKLVEGGTNRSYGIQVARLAGIPPKIIKKAKKVLSNIESGEHNLASVKTLADPASKPEKDDMQLPLFRKTEDIIIEKLSKIDLSNMTPLDAMNKLNELKEKARTVTTPDSC